MVDLKNVKQGFIFVCSRGTQEECFKRMLFGSTWDYEERVLKIKKGDVGYLYNLDTHVLFGVFEAVSNGALEIEPMLGEAVFLFKSELIGWKNMSQ